VAGRAKRCNIRRVSESLLFVERRNEAVTDLSKTQENGSGSRTGSAEGACGLVVDDEPPVREVVAELLREICGRVYEAADGLEALDALAEHPD
jgi:PleD family two-component response regulator